VKLVPLQSINWPIDYEDGVIPISEDEGCRLKSYLCPAGKWSCGWGETDGVGPNTRWTQEYADQRFCDSLTERANAVLAACIVEPTAHQLSALVSFAYNYGGWVTSSVMKAHNRADFLSASRAFGLVNQYTDPQTKQRKVSSGLTARRAREAALYLKTADGQMSMPQEVAPQTTIASSPIAASGVVAAGTGVISFVAQAGETFGTVNTTLKHAKTMITETLGIPDGWFLPIAMVAAGCIAVWYRLKQRIQGWV
jgi:lysozyme